MAVDYFLKIDGIEGESTDAKHKGQIDVASWSWGVTLSAASSPGGGGGAGKADPQDFHFVARTSKASPKLFLACASGQHLKSAILTARKAGKDLQEFLKWTMTDVLVSSFQTGGSEAADVVPTDQVSLNVSKVQVEYKAQNPDGSLGSPVKAGWDFEANQKI